MFLIKGGFPETTLVITKHSDSTRGKKRVDVLVSANVLAETMNENEDCFRVVGLVSTSVDLGRLGPS
jgi:hypothetical protein